MNKFFGFFSLLNKDEKIDDRSMFAHTVVTVVVIVLCLAAMSLTAYAYFTYNVASNSNKLKAASFDVDVSVEIQENIQENSQKNTQEDNQENNQVNIREITETDGKYIFEKKIYDITVTASGTAEKGFCVVYIRLSDGTSKICHTKNIHTDPSNAGNVVSYPARI